MKFHFSLKTIIPLFVLTGLIFAGLLYVTESTYAHLANPILFVTLIVGAAPLFYDISRSILHKQFGVDLIALAAIAGSLIFGQYVAGTVILLMLSGGEALEGFALRRARKELTSLINNAPTTAHRKEGDRVVDISAADVQVGDTILVKPGEVIPVDGRVTSGTSMVDESALTGEPIPVQKSVFSEVMSGSVSEDGVLEIEALRPSTDSKYERIIRLVKEAEENKAPFVRLADRYSVWFTSIAFILAFASWVVTRDPVRALAVLVVATPCPLILATPIAFASGISRAAKRGIIVKNGGVLEQLGEARTLAFDKTGTLTLGIPSVLEIRTFGSKQEDDILRIAASLDQLSTHTLAKSITQEAIKRKLTWEYPTAFEETFGKGVSGTVHHHTYHFGSMSFLKKHGIDVSHALQKEHDELQDDGKMIVYLADSQHVLGAITFADHVRPQVRELFRGIERLNIDNVVMLTGDRKEPALRAAAEIGIPEASVRAELLPEEKTRKQKS
jgi:heavy metal translocating P-type ATPase